MIRPSTAMHRDAPPAPKAGSSVGRQARFWDRTARRYAADPIADMAGYEATLARVQGLLDSSHEVLEVGCGTGSTALRLAPVTRRLRATDASAGMIAIAREKLDAQPVPQLSFEVAEADALAFGAAAYDVVLAFNVLHLVDDLDRALARLVQTLRPGGLLVTKTPCVAEMSPLITRLVVPLMRAIGKAPDVLVFHEAALTEAMTRQGLEMVSVERHGTRGKDFRVFTVARRPP